MRLTSFTDYGLRMLMLLASQPGQALSTAEMAARLRLSRNHLTKILQRLARGGLVQTRRGGGGGAVLAKAPEEIRLGAVVRLLEGGPQLVECLRPGGGTCTFDGCCGLKVRLRLAEAAFLADLDRSTLADITHPTVAA
ncbi:transcriptional regulator, BadM/Rrf2 family [Paracoccus halophilus]|uniref:Rrf2 family transcriptional regulator n=1 Tax=Paracoccus halophilus TaxID=376733 RepID=A0A099F813_9RHOB|nr:Rrf2 family transcriptional regulator [Paracoccus halophilus]KGJ06845.1 Rrf2 family transcriptional regulator [Paracoccus halophilus]SFA41173.1 transcriptional regulator, BadM/Rrf2 family [Paracoccus halophilus]